MAPPLTFPPPIAASVENFVTSPADSPHSKRRFWRKPEPFDRLAEDQAEAVLARLRQRFFAQADARDLAAADKGSRRGHYADAGSVSQFIALVRALIDGGRITVAQYACFVGSRLESVVDHRCMEGSYDAELQPITSAMDKVRRRHGLSPEEFWLRSDEPEEFHLLDKEYTTALDRKLVEVMREFGEDALADLVSTNRLVYEALREEGRLATFESENLGVALASAVKHYENEAARAGSVGAYLAGALMWGAAAEGRLLLKCVLQPDVAASARLTMAGERRPKSADPFTWTLEHLILVAAEAGWVSSLDDDDLVIVVEGLVHQLRALRNLVHPGRYVRERPHLTTDESTFIDARTAYHALCLNLDAQPPKEGS